MFFLFFTYVTLSTAWAENPLFYFNREIEKTCEGHPKILTLKELEEKFRKIPPSGVCDIYEVSYFEKLSDIQESPSLDGYNGPILIVKVIANGGRGSSLFNGSIFSFREGMVCQAEIENRQMVAYNLRMVEDVVENDLLIRKNIHFRKSVLYFQNDQLMGAGQLVLKGGRRSNVNNFECGELPGA